MRRTLPLLFLCILITPQLHAADLTKIVRSIRKEPVYQSKTPRYCLLVFGPEATTHVWLVLDGKTLYVDCNGNGDLTEGGEKFAAKRGIESLDEDVFEVDEIRDGARTHKNLTVHVRKLDYLATNYPEWKEKIARLPGGRGCNVYLDIELPGWKGKGEGGRIRQVVSFLDPRGPLVFADKLRDAPIIHFGGPWQIECRHWDRLMMGQETELTLSIATPGLGAGTTAYLFYDGTIPENVHPHVEITYPAAKPGAPPLKRLYELKERC
jgi:hypothetical protein